MKLLKPLSLASIASLALLLIACGDPGPNPGDPADPDPAEPTACVRTTDCSPEMVCDSTAEQCVASLACSTNADCGLDAHCDDGSCARSTTGVACDSDDDCYPGDACFSGHCGCAGDTVTLDPVAPNVVIVLDRSQSMTNSGGSDSKWNLAVAAVDAMVRDFGDEIRFGLVLYSSDDDCAPGDLDVEVGDGTAASISTALGNASPDGRTPIGATLEAMRSYDGLRDPNRANYVLLLTDGQESCGGDAAAAAGELVAQPSSVRTFVVGFGDGVDADSLNEIALAGDTDAGIDGDRYYKADSGASLQAAFDVIAGSVLGCSFQLPPAPADASELWVFVGEDEVPQASAGADGWSYDPTTEQVTIAGPSCDALSSGSADSFSFVRGCPTYVP